MSTAAFTTLQAPGGTVPTETVRRGTAKSWINFNGVPATPVIRNSFNISSLVDGGVGIYAPTFTVAMPSADHASVACSGDDVGNRAVAQCRLFTSSSYGLYTQNHGNAFLVDAQYVCGETNA
ncbi:hypothetical protein [Nostoc phage Nsp-JY18]